MGRHLSTIGSAKPSASRNAVRAAAASDKKMEVMLGTSATSDTVTCLRFSRASAELANNLRGGILCEQIASSCRLANMAFDGLVIFVPRQLPPQPPRLLARAGGGGTTRPETSQYIRVAFGTKPALARVPKLQRNPRSVRPANGTEDAAELPHETM